MSSDAAGLPVPAPAPVPVYDCHVLLTRPAAPGGLWRARCAAAPHLTAEGPTERDALRAIVARFKFFLHEHRLQGQPIPWTQPPATPTADEVERWIPVHL